MPQEKKSKQPKSEDWYDIDTVASATDCTGLIPTPPASEGEAESYAELMNVPQVHRPPDNGLQSIRPQKKDKEKHSGT